MRHIHEQGEHLSARAIAVSRPGQAKHVATLEGETLLLQAADETCKSIWRLHRQQGRTQLEWMTSGSSRPGHRELLAAIEIAFVHHPSLSRLDLLAPVDQADDLLRRGIALQDTAGCLAVDIEMFWQLPGMWLVPPETYAFPITYRFSDGRRHPLRPPKPAGTVYRRHIPWLDRTLSFRTVDAENDLARFNRWMNDPVVAASWREEGGLSKHRAYLESIAADPHTIGLVACLDEDAFGYFEVYWAKEDRIAPFYDADDFDRGWHVLIGEPRFRGKPFVTAWLPSISHYLFLDDCRTRRIVIEPRTDNHKMIRNLIRCGYANLKEFEFPHKRAVLAMLLRERFFADRLWIPS